LLGISGAKPLLDAQKDDIQFILHDSNNQGVFSTPVDLLEWGDVNSDDFRELSQGLVSSGWDLKTVSLELARDYNNVVDTAKSLVAVDEVGAVVVLKTPDLSRYQT
jgi:hypothetical protein